MNGRIKKPFVELVNWYRTQASIIAVLYKENSKGVGETDTLMQQLNNQLGSKVAPMCTEF